MCRNRDRRLPEMGNARDGAVRWRVRDIEELTQSDINRFYNDYLNGVIERIQPMPQAMAEYQMLPQEGETIWSNEYFWQSPSQ